MLQSNCICDIRLNTNPPVGRDRGILRLSNRGKEDNLRVFLLHYLSGTGCSAVGSVLFFLPECLHAFLRG